MLIKMLTLQAGPTGTREAGKLYDVPDKEAKMLIEGGYAVEAKRGLKPIQKATGARGREQTAEKIDPAFAPVSSESVSDEETAPEDAE